MHSGLLPAGQLAAVHTHPGSDDAICSFSGERRTTTVGIAGWMVKTGMSCWLPVGYLIAWVGAATRMPGELAA